MKIQDGIISKMEISEGYNIRIGKSLWYCLCFLLNLITVAISQASGPDYPSLSIGVLVLSLVGSMLAGYYFYTFRDRIRWAVIFLALTSWFFTVEMLLRVWSGIRIV